MDIFDKNIATASIKPQTDSIDHINIKINNNNRYNNCSIIFELKDRWKTIAVEKQNCRNIKSGYRKFTVNKNVDQKKTYWLKIYSKNATEDNCISVIYDGERPCVDIYGGDYKCEYVDEIKTKYKKGLISVVITTYNSSKTIERTIKSVLSQLYNNYEIVVIDDGSEDYFETADIVRKYNISCITSGHNGACKARNEGERFSNGEFIFFLDADTKLANMAFMMMIQKLHENKKAGWCYCNYMLGDKWKHFKDFDRSEMYERNCSSTMSLIRHDLIFGDDLILFDEDLKRYQDWDLFIRIMEAGYNGVWENHTLFEALDSPNGISKGSISDKEARSVLHNKNNRVALK